MTCRSTLLLVVALAPVFGFGESASSPAIPAPLTLPAGTPLPLQIDRNLPMRVGTPIRARLLYPIFNGQTLAVPADTVVLGSITGFNADHARRVHARLNADFTPFHIPVVRFTQMLLPDGSSLALPSDDASNGAPIFRIVAPPPPTGGFLHQKFDAALAAAKDRLHVITGPDKGDRLKQFFYSQLPYHPQRVAKGTTWTVETTQPVLLAANQLPPPPSVTAPPAATDGPPTWMVQAYLNDALTSASTKVGQEIKATVAEPIYNADGTVAVPQGSVLVGAVTKAKPARRLARAGVLSFSFRQLVLPGQEAQSVQTTLKGTDASTAADLAMNSEGEVKPKAQDKIVIPALLALLATRPFDSDGEHQLAKDGASSNSLGTIGFIIGLAAQSPSIATGIGAYGAALSIYDRILARGKQVTFPRDTRIVLQTTGRRSAAIKPNASAERPR